MSSPKFCVPLRYKPEGGMYTFLENLLRYFRKTGVPYTHDLTDAYDILFTFSFKLSFEQIFEIKQTRPEVRVIHRVDGCPRDYGRMDNSDAILAEVNTLADLTIFQSQYARYSTREKHRVIHQDGPVIYNPVDIDVFCPRPQGEKSQSPYSVTVGYVSFSPNPMKGLADVYTAASACPDMEFVLCGSFPSGSPLPNVKLLGCMPNLELAPIYRSCDVFYFPSENEACPNVVLEALASGLPVLYKDSGATSELVGDCGFAVTPADFRLSLGKILARREELAQTARRRAMKCFSPDVIFPQYLDAVARSRRQPLPMSVKS